MGTAHSDKLQRRANPPAKTRRELIRQKMIQNYGPSLFSLPLVLAMTSIRRRERHWMRNLDAGYPLQGNERQLEPSAMALLDD